MRIPIWAVVCFILCESAFGQDFGAEPDEGPPVLFASSVLDEELLQGEHYKVSPIVRVERFRYHFTLNCEHGEVDVWGIDGVIEGGAELEAISKLEKISQTESFARSFSNALKTPVVKAWSVASRPVKTVKGFPMGVNRYLRGKFYEVKRGSQKAAAYVRKKTNGESKEEEPLEESDEEATGTKKEPVSKRLKHGSSKLSRKHLGFDKAKRRWAKRLRVDPYSKNELLQDALGRIAWASTLGSFSGDFVMPVSDGLSYAGRAEGVVWAKSPTELERLNHIALKKLGFEPDEILAFHDNDLFSLTQKVELVFALKALKNVDGKSGLMDLSLGVEDDHDTVFISSIFDVLASYHENVAELERIEIRRGLAVGISEDGGMILPLALDYLHWSPEMAEALLAKELKAEKRELWLTGKVSPISKYRLQMLNWKIEELCDEKLSARESSTKE